MRVVQLPTICDEFLLLSFRLKKSTDRSRLNNAHISGLAPNALIGLVRPLPGPPLRETIDLLYNFRYVVGFEAYSPNGYQFLEQFKIITHLISLSTNDAGRLSLSNVRTFGAALAGSRRLRARATRQHRARVTVAHGRAVHAPAVSARVHSELAQVCVVLRTDYTRLRGTMT